MADHQHRFTLKALLQRFQRSNHACRDTLDRLHLPLGVVGVLGIEGPHLRVVAIRLALQFTKVALPQALLFLHLQPKRGGHSGGGVRSA